ncbi:MAG: hypothetical protein WA987_16685 [Cellvibrio sp.]|jgi:hypothetical protein
MPVIDRRISVIYTLCYVLLCALCSTVAVADETPYYQLNYTVELQPEKDRALVTMEVDRGDLLRHIEFNVKRDVYSNIKANGEFVIKDGRAIWKLPPKDARLSLYIKITNERDPGRFDAMMTEDWAIFRGDNIVPAVHTYEAPGATAIATLEFKLPKDWSIETGWPRKRGNTFRIDNPERRFDRPIGWMIAGKLGTRRSKIGNTNIAVSAPKGSGLRRMDALTFLGFVWPQLENAFGESPQKLLIVGGDDPLWRGGLSASNSLFLHADRPMVSEDGTSPLIHELVHMVTRISGAKEKHYSEDWFAEGLAEFYSIELLYRANGMTKERRNQIMTGLRKKGAEIETLRAKRSHGPITARAVVLLDDLDREIRAQTKNKHNIDDVTRALIPIRKVSLNDLRKVTAEITGVSSKTLQSPLLKEPKPD